MNKLEYPITYMNKDYYTIEEVLRDSYEIYKHNIKLGVYRQTGVYRGHSINLDLDIYECDYSVYELVDAQIYSIDENC